MKYSFFFISICLVWACQSETEIETEISPSGYKYIHHIKTGGVKPQTGEEVVFIVDFRTDSTLIQTSRDQPQPAKFLVPPMDQLGKTVSPIVEAVLLMSVGDSMTVIQSTDSLPNKPPILGNSKFIYYDVVLLEINSKEAVEKERAAQIEKMKVVQAQEEEIGAKTKGLLDKYKANSLDAELKTTASGLKYYIIEEGSGPQVTAGGLAQVHYYGMTTDGNEFDNSYKKGAPYPVPVGRGQVIRGWDEGLVLFKEGTKAVLFIPGALGYGAAGSPPNIGPNAELVFYINITDFK